MKQTRVSFQCLVISFSRPVLVNDIILTVRYSQDINQVKIEPNEIFNAIYELLS